MVEIYATNSQDSLANLNVSIFVTSTPSAKERLILTVRFAQLQDDVGLGLGLLLHVASLGRDLVNVDDESGHGFGFLVWFG